MVWLNETPVSDIKPLEGAPLESLTLHRTKVSDLSPLVGSTIQRLHIAETPVTDLTPITGLRLTRLIFTPSRITAGLEEVRSMLSIGEIGTQLETKMHPTRFWALYDEGKMEE
jgi:hypothetical protein